MAKETIQDSQNQSSKSNTQNIIHLDEKESNNSKTKHLNNKKIFNKIKSFFSRFSNFKYSAITSKLKFIKFNKVNLVKNKFFLYIFFGILIVISLIIALFFILDKQEPLSRIYEPKAIQTLDSKSDFTKMRPIDGKELQSLMQKAYLLYNSGQISDALGIYSNIAIYSQSFANFNLGVAKMNENQYKASNEAFNNTIGSGDNVSAAAINAAVNSYNLKDLKLYDYYVNLAKGTMIDWYKMPLYSYLYSLVNYYSQNYFNMLSSLKNPNPNFYKDDNAKLLSKIYLLFNDDYNALKTLIDNPNIADGYTLGLLYARMGEYDLAYNQIDSYLSVNGEDSQALMAGALIELKRSNFTQVSRIYEMLLTKQTQDELQNIYPIKIKLQDSLFDVNKVQENLWNKNSNQTMTMYYKILFYFAPFRVFDIDNALSIIREGGLELKMNNIQEAGNILLSGAMLSSINADITKGLKEILTNNINNALNIMKEASIRYPNHQVLQYNLGLIYAQLNDFENAKKHFLKSFHLDNNDVLSGIFYLMCAKLTNSDSSRILNDITNNFESINFDDQLEGAFLHSLFGFINGNIYDDLLWFNSNNPRTSKTPIMYALRALYSVNSRDKNIIANTFLDLQKQTNNDMVAMILYRIARHYNENIKLFSLTLFEFFKNDLKNLDLVYTGPSFARQVYIYMAFLVGANSYVDTLLTNKLLDSQDKDIGILQALALNSIYLGEFEKAFVYYNALIDDYKLQTSENYFLASVAAIGAKHYDNAVALIQLSRLKSDSNLESRYALGLLHQSMGNFKFASMQFIQIGDIKFKSDFFDFEIDTSKILKE